MQKIKTMLFLTLAVWLPVMGQLQQVISSNGGNFENGNYSICFTLGEPVISTFSSGSYILSQGFHQPTVDTSSQNAGRLLIKAYLQGAFTASSTMDTSLKAGGHLPLSQPYDTSPWNYPGTEHISVIPPGMIDWVLVEVRSSLDTIVARQAAILREDGMIYDTAFQPGVSFDSLAPGSYYVVIDHRNHMPIMTASKQMVPAPVLRDLTNPFAYPPFGGSNAAANLGGRNGLISGDISKDGILKYSGAGNDRALIFQRLLTETGSSSIITTANGYFQEDLSMNGNLKYSGLGNDAALIIQNLVNMTGTTAITSTLTCPVPLGIVKK